MIAGKMAVATEPPSANSRLFQLVGEISREEVDKTGCAVAQALDNAKGKDRRTKDDQKRGEENGHRLVPEVAKETRDPGAKKRPLAMPAIS